MFLSDIEIFFILSDIKWNHPWIASLISWIPLQSVQYFLGAMDRVAEVSVWTLVFTDSFSSLPDDQTQHGAKSFNNYVEQYGRDSGRKDLLTKILSVKPDSGEAQLSDYAISIEIGNLIFAGTGMSNRVSEDKRHVS